MDKSKKVLEKVKEVIKTFYHLAPCGIFDTRNYMGDPMETIYDEGGVQIDICRRYRYFEVFGLSDEECEQLGEFYKSLEEEEK